MWLGVLRWLLPLAGLAVLFWGSLFLFYDGEVLGDTALITPWTVIPLMLGLGDELAQAILMDLRMPRSVVAVLLGAMLAVAGALMQAITRNPLASPTLLGVNAGASLGMVVVTALMPAVFSGFSVAMFASIGGVLSWILVMMISGGVLAGSDYSRIILAGMTVSAFCMAVTKAVLIIAEDHAANIMNWLAGSVANTSWEHTQIILPFFVAMMLFCLIFASRLNVLSLSDESAQSLGVNVKRLRWYANVMTVLIVGSTVSVAGPIGFIGLLIPHLARFWVGYDYRKVLFMSMILGATLMLMADILARWLAFPYEIPAGAVLALIGAPIFVVFARGRRQ